MTDIQKQLIDLKPGASTRINGRFVAGTYTGWHIQIGEGALFDSCELFTSLPEAAAELEGKQATDAA